MIPNTRHISRFAIKYAGGSQASGVVASDTVTVAGLTVQNQGLGAVTNSNLTGASPMAGLFGLGFPPNSLSGATPWFVNLVNQRVLLSNIFAFYMARGGAQGSELCIGCVDSSKYTGTFTYHPLNPGSTGGIQRYWNIMTSGFSYNGGTPTGPVSTVIDSGLTFVTAPTAVAANLYASIPGSQDESQTISPGSWSIPCNTTGTVSLVIDGTAYAINGQDFNRGPISRESDRCFGGIMGNDATKGHAVVGDEFMKSWYLVFDYGNSRIGFAQPL